MLTSWKLIGNPRPFSRRLWREAARFSKVAAEAGLPLPRASGKGPGIILGGLAERLGFARGVAISEDDLTNLLSGKDAAGNSVTRRHKVNGIDLTFSAPKSVSVAGLVTVRDAKIIAAHDQAVRETMAEIEAQCGAARLTPTTKVQTGNMVYALVAGGLSAKREPHLYTHVVVANMTAYRRQILGLDGQLIMRLGFNHLWGATYREKLGRKLSRLGYSVSKVAGGQWRLDAVAPEIELAFSSRTREIRAQRERGASDLWAREKTRREHVGREAPRGLFKAWETRLAAVGTPGSRGQA